MWVWCDLGGYSSIEVKRLETTCLGRGYAHIFGFDIMS